MTARTTATTDGSIVPDPYYQLLPAYQSPLFQIDNGKLMAARIQAAVTLLTCPKPRFTLLDRGQTRHLLEEATQFLALQFHHGRGLL